MATCVQKEAPGAAPALPRSAAMALLSGLDGDVDVLRSALPSLPETGIELRAGPRASAPEKPTSCSQRGHRDRREARLV